MIYSSKKNAIRMRAAYKKDPEKYRAISRRNLAANPESKDQRLARLLKSRYGLSLPQYRRLLKKQNGRCAICKLLGVLSIDHCHTTKKVRGLLCGNCNRGIGCLKESPANLMAAIKYLKESKL